MTTNHSLACDEIEPLLAAWALGEQDNEAWRLCREHLATCAACRRRLASYQEIARLLPLAAPEASLPADLGERLAARVNQELEKRPEQMPFWPYPYRSRWSWGWAAFAVNLLLIVALIAWNFDLRSDQLALIARQRQSWGTLVEILNSPGVRRVALTPAEGLAASGSFFFTPGQRRGCLVVDDMPTLAQGQVYQLWLIGDGRRVSGGTFRVDGQGRGWVLVDPGGPLDSYGQLGITLEPAGGSVQPTSPRMIGTNL